MSQEKFGRMTVIEAKSKMDAGWKPIVIDVRKAFEFQIAELDFVDIKKEHEMILDLVETLPKDQDILITCRSGARSAAACAMLAQAGFDRCINLEGGILAWAVHIDTSLQTY